MILSCRQLYSRILLREHSWQSSDAEAIINTTKYPLSALCPETFALLQSNYRRKEELKGLFWNTKDGTAERIWVFEHLDKE